MAFIAQILLSDLPDDAALESRLMSFHYCQECMDEGDASYGWTPPSEPQPIPLPTIGQSIVNALGIAPLPMMAPWQDSHSYDVAIFSHTQNTEPDGLGILAESPLRAGAMNFSDPIPDYPASTDYPDDLANQLPEEFFLEESELDVIEGSKLGGWPTWMQDAQYPPGRDGKAMQFVAQIDHTLGGLNCAWGGGGCAYLFADLSDPKLPFGQLVIQTT